MAAKFFTGLPLDGPDPECVRGHGAPPASAERPRPTQDHSRRVPVTIGRARPPAGRPVSACEEDPLAGFDPAS